MLSWFKKKKPETKDQQQEEPDESDYTEVRNVIYFRMNLMP